MDFNTLLETKSSDVKAPVNLPQGTYTWNVYKQPKISEVESPKGHWDVIEFPIKAVSAEDDVDEDELADYGKPSQAINRISFMFSKDPDDVAERERTLYNLNEFMRNVLIVDADEDASISEMLAGSVNCQFLASATHTIQEDGRVFVNVKNYAALD